MIKKILTSKKGVEKEIIISSIERGTTKKQK